MARTRASLLIAALALAGCASSPTRVTSLPGTAQDLPDFEARLERLRGLLGVPGMTAAVGHNGHLAWTGRFGLADVGAATAPVDTTAFHLASLTKLFGAVVLLKLVDSGLVRLDDSVGTYGVVLPNNGTIRVRHLLSMTSGGATPGATFAYDGDRFAWIGQVIRQASGRTFSDLAMAWITQPLAMRRTAPNVESSAAFAFSGLGAPAYRSAMARPYASAGGVFTLATYPASMSVSAGMISTATDMVHFAQALDSGTILSPAMRTLMFAPTVTPAGDTLPYALGTFSQRIGGVRVIWAYGLWTSISSLLIHVPERGLTFVVLANADRLSADYPLGAGRLMESPVAQEFLRAFVLEQTIVVP